MIGEYCQNGSISQDLAKRLSVKLFGDKYISKSMSQVIKRLCGMKTLRSKATKQEQKLGENIELCNTLLNSAHTQIKEVIYKKTTLKEVVGYLQETEVAKKPLHFYIATTLCCAVIGVTSKKKVKILQKAKIERLKKDKNAVSADYLTQSEKTLLGEKLSSSPKSVPDLDKADKAATCWSKGETLQVFSRLIKEYSQKGSISHWSLAMLLSEELFKDNRKFSTVLFVIRKLCGVKNSTGAIKQIQILQKDNEYNKLVDLTSRHIKEKMPLNEVLSSLQETVVAEEKLDFYVATGIYCRAIGIKLKTRQKKPSSDLPSPGESQTEQSKADENWSDGVLNPAPLAQSQPSSQPNSSIAPPEAPPEIFDMLSYDQKMCEVTKKLSKLSDAYFWPIDVLQGSFRYQLTQWEAYIGELSKYVKLMQNLFPRLDTQGQLGSDLLKMLKSRINLESPHLKAALATEAVATECLNPAENEASVANDQASQLLGDHQRQALCIVVAPPRPEDAVTSKAQTLLFKLFSDKSPDKMLKLFAKQLLELMKDNTELQQNRMSMSQMLSCNSIPHELGADFVEMARSLVRLNTLQHKMIETASLAAERYLRLMPGSIS